MTQKLSSPLHFVGILGVGMRALAEYAVSQGFIVQGSDIGAAQNKKPLSQSIQIFSDHNPENLKNCKAVIYSTAISMDNKEILYAMRQNIPLMHRSDLLDYFLRQTPAITIAGTHGKTTTAAMLTCFLNHTGHPSAAVVGGTLKNSYENVDKNAEYLVAEADESDGSFTKYSSYISVINNIAKDHMEYFGSTENLCATFAKYLNNTQKDGIALIGWDDEYCRTLGQAYTGPKITYGFTIGCDVRALSYSVKGGRMYFDIIVVKKRVSGSVPVIGKHNLQNALACYAAAHFLEIGPAQVTEGLDQFKGVVRRMDVLHDSEKLKIIDDYAHNPGKIQAAINGVRESWPDWPVVVFFQPHRYSRLKTLYPEFCKSFLGANKVCVLTPFAAGEPIDKDFDPEAFVARIGQESETDAVFAESFENAIKIADNISDRTILLTVGAGDVSSLARRFIPAK